MSEKKYPISLTNQNFSTLSVLYGVSSRTFQIMVKEIRPELDRIVGRKKYRILTPAQVRRIVDYLGSPF